MQVYNYSNKKNIKAYLLGIVTGIIGTIICLTITNMLEFYFSFIYALIPISIDFGYKKANGLKTDNYIHYIGLTGMTLLFLSMVYLGNFEIRNFILNMLFLLFGIQHCSHKI